MPFLRTTLPLLLLIFGISVLVRLPQLNRPLSKHHEFCTAVTLRVLDIWHQEGAEKYHYNPAMNYPGAANQYINNHANTSGQMIDRNGTAYYVSHPPFAYLFPYFIFKLLNRPPTVAGLQAIHLALHWLSALFVYFTVCLLSFNRARNLPFIPALVAYVVYLFSPATLWFQGNVYMSDMLVQVPFITGTYTALKMIIRQKFHSPKYLFFYSVLLFIMLITSWLGYFFALGMMIYCLLHLNRNSGFKTILIATVAGVLLAIRFTVMQYAQINGINAYLNEAVSRYLVRGSFSDLDQGYFAFAKTYVIYLVRIFFNYIANYLPVYLVMIWFAYVSVSRRKMKILFTENGYRFIWLSVMPVLMLHFVFLEYSGQDFTTLYGAFFFSVLLGILYDKLKKNNIYTPQQLNTMVVAGVLVMLLQFYFINRPGATSVKGFAYNTYERGGKMIAQMARPDEVVFLQHSVAEPQLVYYARRNLKEVKNLEEAQRFLKVREINQGIVFGEQNGKYIFIQRITSSNQQP